MKYQTCCSSDIEINVASVWQRDQCLLHIGQLQVNDGDGNGDGGTSRDLDCLLLLLADLALPDGL